MQSKHDIHARVTQAIIASLENGVRPWIKPWAVQAPGCITRPRRHNGTPYRGINILLLWSEAADQVYSSPYWLTFKQAHELKARVRKGTHGVSVVYADRFTKSETNDEGEAIERQIPFLRTYTVFNAEQIEGLPAHFYAQPAPQTQRVERIAHAEAFMTATDARVVHGGSQACYVPRHDHIHMPCIDAFRDAESYYGTLLHEATHWTLHPTRLDRDFNRDGYGEESYAREELVAELGAAFLCADLGIAAEPREDHAAYLGSWLKVLKGDKRAIFQAAAHAQRACDYLHELQPQPPKGGGRQAVAQMSEAGGPAFAGPPAPPSWRETAPQEAAQTRHSSGISRGAAPPAVQGPLR